MHSLARAAGDRFVLVSTRINLFGRPALHVLARVRTTEEESAHGENGSTIDLLEIKNKQISSFRVWRFRRREPSRLQPSRGAVLSKADHAFPAQCANILRRSAGIVRLATPSGELPNTEASTPVGQAGSSN